MPEPGFLFLFLLILYTYYFSAFFLLLYFLAGFFPAFLTAVNSKTRPIFFRDLYLIMYLLNIFLSPPPYFLDKNW
jgi:glycosyltransferase involved in cell wall biosynthesis